MIAVIDYGAGNVGSLLAALAKHTSEVIFTGDPHALRAADAAILPGDGAFGATMDALRTRELLPAISEIITDGKPFLGICVGMQILFEGSDEFGATRGLGIFAGEVTRFKGTSRVPHIGWTKLEILRDHGFVSGLSASEYAYFMHSHRAPVVRATAARADNEGAFSAVVAERNVMGTQFHPEKSQATGARLLANFVKGTTHGTPSHCSA
ncbi:MAG: imidazole glycerol phosphate synthase subunit HisH [Candidatus Eremiobacteraeota bacterium]|nr:imidazole glycerol phosphate synthase subunit HisH [Candidatus Eremiobacteraeota bacterium]